VISLHQAGGLASC